MLGNHYVIKLCGAPTLFFYDNHSWRLPLNINDIGNIAAALEPVRKYILKLHNYENFENNPKLVSMATLIQHCIANNVYSVKTVSVIKSAKPLGFMVAV